MGKPYHSELETLDATYACAMGLDLECITRVIADCRALPLFAVGSGGSFSAAHIGASLHEAYTSMLAKPVTPLELTSSLGRVRNTAVMFLTAGGANPDVLGTFRKAAEAEPAQLIVICGQSGSPLARQASAYKYVDFVELASPVGKDGFLATNSLLYFAVVLARAYAVTAGSKHVFPASLRALLHPRATRSSYLSTLVRKCAPLWKRQILVVLFGPETHSAAVDLESKFTEAALGMVQIADFRNFAHGRHHWLAKHGDVSAVLALSTIRDRELATRTLSLIPRSIPTVLLPIAHMGVQASLAAMVTGFFVSGIAGKARGIDPGRPGVPSFGRKIYHLNTFRSRPKRLGGLTPCQVAAIERKTASPVESLQGRGALSTWFNAYRRFLGRVQDVEFGSVVLDYDGTLCDPSERFKGLSSEAAAELIRLARAGLRIGVVTGRGKSVRRDLRREIPYRWWDTVLIGYYNGGDVAPLAADDHPLAGDSNGVLGEVARLLRQNRMISRQFTFECKRPQITLMPKLPMPLTAACDALRIILLDEHYSQLTIVRSAHSIDVLAPGISKRTIVTRMGEMSGPVLCVGDQGRWPGNDCALLAEEYSLSAREVSPDPQTCWNLAPPGQLGVAATLYYLRSLQSVEAKGRMTLRLAGH